MTEAERLAERLRELLAKATPGPWQYHCSHIYGPDPERVFVTQAYGSAGNLVADRDLIVEAINALPTLLARIAALEEVLRAIEDMETNWALGIDGGMVNARRAARKALGKGSE